MQLKHYLPTQVLTYPTVCHSLECNSPKCNSLEHNSIQGMGAYLGKLNHERRCHGRGQKGEEDEGSGD